jgi:hypothetical protein
MEMCDCSAFTAGGVHGEMVCLGRKLRILNSAKMSVSMESMSAPKTRQLSLESSVSAAGMKSSGICRNLWFL